MVLLSSKIETVVREHHLNTIPSFLETLPGAISRGAAEGVAGTSEAGISGIVLMVYRVSPARFRYRKVLCCAESDRHC
jgi:hypothetical protein